MNATRHYFRQQRRCLTHPSQLNVRCALQSRRVISIRPLTAFYSTHNSSPKTTTRENIYTLPNLLTTSRIIACPFLGWSIVQGNIPLATGILAYAGISDLVSYYWFTAPWKMH